MTVEQVRLFERLQIVPNIPGLSYIPDFITKSAEEALVRTIDEQPWLMDLKRRVQHYGYRYDYKARNISPQSRLGDVPDWLLPYCRQLIEERLFQAIPDQVIVNEYQPGQGISAHIDCIPCFGPIVASLSLGSACVMDFNHSQTSAKASLLLEPRSLLVLSDEARYLWKHAIPARKTDYHNGNSISRSRRLSLTFRTIKT